MARLPRPAPRRREPVRGGWRAAAAAGATALLLCACATVPDSGAVQAGKVALTAGGQNPDYLQLIPVPPKPGWSAVQVVQGFLAACASFANNHAVAREYLDSAKRRKWKPRWAVTVVGAPKVGQAVNLAPHSGAPYNQEQQVSATGEKLATLSDNGQYRGTTGSSTLLVPPVQDRRAVAYRQPAPPAAAHRARFQARVRAAEPVLRSQLPVRWCPTRCSSRCRRPPPPWPTSW